VYGEGGSSSGSALAEYTYRPDGMRISRKSGGKKTYYLYAGQTMLAEFAEKAGGGFEIKASYMPGAHGIVYRKQAGQVPEWYMYDGLGSVVGIMTAEKNRPTGATEVEVLATRIYDVYGNIRGNLGIGTKDNDPNWDRDFGTKHQFCGGLGHMYDSETSLIYMRARYYDPELGRFVSEDPAENGLNYYVYCNGNPVPTIL
jgi:RHS repeat-associated protein